MRYRHWWLICRFMVVVLESIRLALNNPEIRYRASMLIGDIQEYMTLENWDK